MFDFLRKLFGSGSLKGSDESESGFDKVMARVDQDAHDLEDIAHDVQLEFEDIHDDLDSMGRQIDELTD